MALVHREELEYSDSLSTPGEVRGAWRAATRPFSTSAWTLCVMTISSLLAGISVISPFRPTPFLHSRNFNRRNMFAQWICNYIRNTSGGSVDLDMRVERSFEPARMILRLSLVSIVGMACQNSAFTQRRRPSTLLQGAHITNRGFLSSALIYHANVSLFHSRPHLVLLRSCSHLRVV